MRVSSRDTALGFCDVSFDGWGDSSEMVSGAGDRTVMGDETVSYRWWEIDPEQLK